MKKRNTEGKTGMMGKSKMVKTKGFNKTIKESRVENESKRMQRKLHMHEKHGQMFAFNLQEFARLISYLVITSLHVIQRQSMHNGHTIFIHLLHLLGMMIYTFLNPRQNDQ
jgi:hypothetical protein